MGVSSSSDISAEQLEEYAELLYLKKSEILHLYKRFLKMAPEVAMDRRARFDQVRIGVEFPEIACNPFVDRIFYIFSSLKDNLLSFEDILDYYSALNENCPSEVKAVYAFKMFDFDGDKQLNREDIIEIIQRLVDGGTRSAVLLEEEKKSIADKILLDMDLDKTGGVTCSEFTHAVIKMPDFSNSFMVKV